jgi:hypothetical protein
MRAIAFALSLMGVAMIIAIAAFSYTTLLLDSERAGFQQAAISIDSTLIADYISTQYTSYCDGDMAYNNPDINPVYMVSAQDVEPVNGQYDYLDRIDDVNNGMFDISSGDVSMTLNDDDNTEISSMSQSIRYSATSTQCDWSDYYQGIHAFRLQAAVQYVEDCYYPFVNRVIDAGIQAITPIYCWLTGWFSSSTNTGDLTPVMSVSETPTMYFDNTPAVTKSAELHHYIPIIIVEGNTDITQSTAGELHMLEVNTYVTFYDIREYFDEVASAWED